MPGDPTSRNDDELLSQIDELKARMDRLMRGGSSTSNSALLTDAAKTRQADGIAEPTPPEIVDERTRVRDLIQPEDTEVIEVYPGPKEVVPFPEVQDTIETVEAPDTPAEAERAQPVGGSLINVPDQPTEQRAPVASFDQLGDAIQQELARDESVPPVDAKKGPDLASRFGPDADSVAVEVRPEAELEEPDVSEEPEEIAEEYYEDSEPEFDDVEGDVPGRPTRGLVGAIWVLTALASGAIAALHFTGVI